MEKMMKQMKPYGWFHTQGKTYPLLNPQPVPRDSCWGSDIYTFFCGVEQAGKMVGGHVITREFTIELIPNIPSIEIQQETEESVDIEWDVISTIEMEEAGFNDPVLDDQYSDLELGNMYPGEE
jgi:hypothetical protein